MDCFSQLILPDFVLQVNSGVVISVGPGGRTRDGHNVPPSVKEGDTVLLPEFGGTQINLGEK
jgi:chaperonin GroES